MILSAQSILHRKPIKDPQHRTEIERDGLRFSSGISPAGYDLTLDEVEGPRCVSRSGESFWNLDPGKFILASTCELFQMPNDLLGVVHDKSSWARRGLAVQNTVIEPGWNGYLTIELTNHGTGTLKLYPGMGICQVIFHVLDQATLLPYDGKYQDQEAGPQGAR